MNIVKVDEMNDYFKRQVSLLKFEILAEQISDLVDIIDDADELNKGEVIEQLKEILTFIKILR